jgi:hypothetical protein
LAFDYSSPEARNSGPLRSGTGHSVGPPDGARVAIAWMPQQLTTADTGTTKDATGRTGSEAGAQPRLEPQVSPQDPLTGSVTANRWIEA